MPRRPPKEFMDSAIAEIRKAGSADDPAAVAAATWKAMGRAARAPWEALRRAREADPPGDAAAAASEPAAPADAAKATPAAKAAPVAKAAIVRALPQVAAADAAAGAIGQVAKILTGDIVVIRTERFHPQAVVLEDRKKPVQMIRKTSKEWHVNPVTIGIGAIGAAIAGFVAMMAWQGVTISSGLGNKTQIAPGVKDTRIGKKISEGGILNGLVSSIEDAINGVLVDYSGLYGSTPYGPGNTEPPPGTEGPPAMCATLQQRYLDARAQNAYTDAARALYQAKNQGCTWAKNL